MGRKPNPKYHEKFYINLEDSDTTEEKEDDLLTNAVNIPRKKLDEILREERELRKPKKKSNKPDK